MISSKVSKLLDDLRYRLGHYDWAMQVCFRRVDRLIFACKGNVCRSVFAEAYARSLGVSAVSFGFEVEKSSPPPDIAISVASEFGTSLGSALSKPASAILLRPTDCVVVMEPWQVRAALQLEFAKRSQTTLLGMWQDDPTISIQDPWGGDEQVFQECFGSIANGVENLVTAFCRVSSTRD